MRLRFVLGEILAGFRRNLTMIAAVILVTFVSLAAVGAALLLQMQIDKIKGEWYDKAEVSIWMCAADEQDTVGCESGAASADQIQAVTDRLAAEELGPYVTSVTEQSAEEVYAYFQKLMAGQKDWAEGVTVDAFGPVLRVKLADPTAFQVVRELVAGLPGVDTVFDQSDLLDRLFGILDKVKIAALAVASVLMVAAILLITTTIRLSALSRRRETGIMRLVGASNLFIQLPFMLEGAVAALIGSALSVGGLWAVSRFWLSDWVEANFHSQLGYVNPMDVFIVAPWLVLAAVVLAGLSSVLTLRRFTKV